MPIRIFTDQQYFSDFERLFQADRARCRHLVHQRLPIGALSTLPPISDLERRWARAAGYTFEHNPFLARSRFFFRISLVPARLVLASGRVPCASTYEFNAGFETHVVGSRTLCVHLFCWYAGLAPDGRPNEHLRLVVRVRCERGYARLLRRACLPGERVVVFVDGCLRVEVW